MSAAGPCPFCRSDKTGSSPTGDWCNDCGWASPGYECEECGRKGVNEHHLSKESTLCKTYAKKPYA